MITPHHNHRIYTCGRLKFQWVSTARVTPFCITCIMNDGTYVLKSTPPRYFSIQLNLSVFCKYVTDILKMCMNVLDAEQTVLIKLRGFNRFLHMI